jgi:hypothetical protein
VPILHGLINDRNCHTTIQMEEYSFSFTPPDLIALEAFGKAVLSFCFSSFPIV